MKNLENSLKKNLILYIEILIYSVLLAINVFFSVEIYNKVIGKIPAGELPVGVEIPQLNSLDEDLLLEFEEDSSNRTLYKIGLNEDHDNRWDSFRKTRVPFQ